MLSVDYALNLERIGLLAFDLKHHQLFIDVMVWEKYHKDPKSAIKLLQTLVDTLCLKLGWVGLPVCKEDDVLACYITTTVIPDNIPIKGFENYTPPPPEPGQIFSGAPFLSFLFYKGHIYNMAVYTPHWVNVLQAAAQKDKDDAAVEE